MRAAAVLVFLVLVAGCGDPPGTEVESLDLKSRAVGRTLHMKVVVPEEHAERPPLLVLLHGRHGDAGSMVSDQLGEGLKDVGDQAPVVLLPDGGDHSYWHDRADGAWGRMVLDEAIPAAIKRYGADPRRVAIGGISMGGFGALDLAAEHPDRFCAVGAHSPAIFPDAASTAEGAFDDAEDFGRHDVLARAEKIPPGAWVDVGDEDPFAPAIHEMVQRMRTPRFHPWKGGHDGDYWHAHTRAYVRFYACALSTC